MAARLPRCSHLHSAHCGGVVRRWPSGVLETALPRARGGDAAGRLLEVTLEPLEGGTEFMPGLDIRVTDRQTADH
jgi:hypothetical protein